MFLLFITKFIFGLSIFLITSSLTKLSTPHGKTDKKIIPSTLSIKSTILLTKTLLYLKYKPGHNFS